MKIMAALTPLQARWLALEPREQTLVGGAAALVGLALVWLLLVAPPLRTLREADVQQRSLDLQWLQMQGLRAQAQALRSQPRLGHDEALRLLDASVKQALGASAVLSLVGDNVSVTLRNTPAAALAQWLPQARMAAHALPSEARLVRSSVTPDGPPAWDGTVVLNLPAP